MNIFKLIILSLVFIFTSKIILAAQTNSVIKNKENYSRKKIITTIKSKNIKIQRLKGQIEFLNNVKLEREDTSFLADQMIVYYDEDHKKSKELLKGKKDNAGSIKKIEALNNVKIFHQEFVATGDTGIYDPKTGIFTIEKNVIFNNGTSTAKGEKFIYNINNKKGYLAGQKKDENKIQSIKTESPSEDGRVMVIIENEDNLKE